MEKKMQKEMEKKRETSHVLVYTSVTGMGCFYILNALGGRVYTSVRGMGCFYILKAFLARGGGGHGLKQQGALKCSRGGGEKLLSIWAGE